MSTIVTRSGKGSPLTNNEVDANFTNLNNDKLESADLSGYAELTGATFTGDVEGTEFIGSLRGNNIFKAQAGEALSKGDAVYISGISGNTPVVSLADADSAGKMPAFGLASDSASANSAVDIVTYGQLTSVDTSAFSLGDTLYVSNTPGQLTSTAPSGESSLVQNLGKVERVHATAGILFVAGAGRTNATPNLNDGQFFLGNGSNQAVSADFTTSVLGEISAGTGIGISLSGVISNSAPDQTVVLTASGATSISGTYPNFTISSVNTTYSVGDGGLTQINFTSADHTKLNGIATSANNYSLPLATSTVRGGIELFSNTDQSVAANGITATAGRTYGIQLNSANQAVVNVPWSDTNTVYTLPLSSSSTRGGVKIGYSENGKNYPVELSSEKMFVNVPWTNTTYSVGDGGLTQKNFTTTLKTKLDNIEASADVTDTTNVVASLTAGSNITIAADGTIASTASGGGETLAQTLALGNTTGGTDIAVSSGDSITLPDAAKIKLGDEPNLEIYHSGSHSFIEDVGGGSLFIKGGPQLKLMNDGENAVLCQKDGAVTLYHNNSAKVATTSSGISVTGNIALSGTADGRDLATDGTKLDGIETGATADQTAAEILTAIKTVDGSGSGLDADTVDGVHESTFMRRSANSQLDMNNNDIVGVDQIFHEGDSDTYMQFHAADQWRVVTGGTERLEVNNSAVTIAGTLNVRTAIDLADNDILRFGSADDVEFFFSGSHFYLDLNAGGNNFYIRDTTTTRFTFDDAGHFTATGNVTAYSDRRLKDDIQPIKGALEKVGTLSGNTYQRNDLLDKDPDRRYAGVIAQEVEVVLPEAVSESEDGTKTVDYNAVIALLVESVKELKAEVEELKGNA